MAGSVLCFAGLCALLWAEHGERRAAIWVSKPLASAGFVAVGWSLAGDAPANPWLLAGLGLCWVGDVLLIPREDRAFQGGIAAFGLGHLAYFVSFTQLGIDAPSALASGLLFSGVAWRVWRWLSPHVPAPLRIPVMVYIAIIVVMAAGAMGSARATSNPRIALAAVAFFASDLAVARDAFVRRAFINRAWGLPTYYAAQWLFATSLHAAGA